MLLNCIVFLLSHWLKRTKKKSWLPPLFEVKPSHLFCPWHAIQSTVIPPECFLLPVLNECNPLLPPNCNTMDDLKPYSSAGVWWKCMTQQPLYFSLKKNVKMKPLTTEICGWCKKRAINIFIVTEKGHGPCMYFSLLNQWPKNNRQRFSGANTLLIIRFIIVSFYIIIIIMLYIILFIIKTYLFAHSYRNTE